MKDFFEILKDNGIEIPEEKKATIKTTFFENYKTVNEFKSTAEKLTNANATIETLTKSVDELEKVGNADVEKLKSDLDEYKQAEEKRKADEESNKKVSGLKSRFSGLNGDNKYINEGTEDWIFNQFIKAVEKSEGKSDKEIFEEITKDKEIYKNPNEVVEIPPVGGSSEKTKFKSFF